MKKAKSTSVILHLHPSSALVKIAAGKLKDIKNTTVSEMADKLVGKLSKVGTLEFSDDSSDMVRRYYEKALKGGVKSLDRNQLIDLISCYAGDFRNIFGLAEALDSNVIKAWDLLIFNESISAPDLLHCANTDISFWISKKNWYPEIIPEPSFLLVQCTYSMWIFNAQDINYRYIKMSLDEDVRGVAFDYTSGAEAKELPTVDDIPDNLVVEDFQDDIVKEVNFMGALEVSKNLIPSSGSISVSTMKTLDRKVNARAFGIDMPAKVPLQRQALVEMAFCKFIQTSRKVDPSEAMAPFVKFVVNNLPKMIIGTAFNFFLPGYKGFTQAWAGTSNADVMMEQLKALLKKDPGKWLDMENFKKIYIACNLAGKPLKSLNLFNSENWSKNKLERTVDVRKKIDFWSDVSFPFILNLLRTLCATGILEIAYDCEKAEELNGIRYIRVTPLGMYALGIDKKIKLPALQSVSESFDLDDENHIITVLNPKSPYISFLNQIGEKIGTTRYRISASSIVASCNFESEVLTRIEVFRKIISSSPSESWETVLSEALKRSKSSLPVNFTRYRIIKLDPEVPGLIQFVGSDPHLAKNIIKAQDSIVLMDYNYYPTFRDYLNKAGYII